MEQVLDLHIHSKYSRSCSPQLTLENIDSACRVKGVDIVATGDFTFPEWFSDIKNKLVETAPGFGLYRLKTASDDKIKFILSTEVALIYKDGGKARRIHLVIHAPSLAAAEDLNNYLDKDYNIRSDGRPILGMSAPELMKLCLSFDKKFLIYPAHIWTPWFAVFGSKSGFDSLKECFHDYMADIYAVETGLSSDPEMNWRLSALDRLTILSNSDAHSLINIGREANVFEMNHVSYDEIYEIIKKKKIYKEMDSRFYGNDKDKGGNGETGVKYTIEFYPEEGMYHLDGHRSCATRYLPEQTRKYKGICPVCKKPLTVGVLNRVEELADRPAFAPCGGATAGLPTIASAKAGEPASVKDSNSGADEFVGFNPPVGQAGFVKLVELDKIIAEALNLKSRASRNVRLEYNNLIKRGGNELNILLNLTADDLGKITQPKIAEGIRLARQGRLIIEPGFDGQYGIIKIFNRPEKSRRQQSSFLDL